MRDALSGIFDVADPTGTVTMDSPVWVSGWNAPLLKLPKAAINANRDDTHDLHRLVDDLFSQIQERLSSGSGGPAAFKTLLTDFADYFDRAPPGAALETLQKFGVRTGTPFSSYLRALRVVVASTVEKGGPLAPSATMAIELVRIRTAQQYSTLMPTLFPGDRATREKSYASLSLMWTTFADLKHNTSFFFSFISLMADGPHHYHPACGHKGSSHLSPVHALQFFYRDASSALLQLVNQWLNFTYSRSHAFRYERKNTNPTLVRIELTTSVLADVQLTY